MLNAATLACLAGLLALALSAPAEAAPASPLKVQPFDLRDVTLLPSPFQAAMQRDRDYLLSLEPDRLLHGFRTEAGLPAKAPAYGGWESMGVAGHTLGHYLSAVSMYYRTTGDPRFKQRIDYIVSELALCQEKNGNGYIAAIPGGKAMFADVAAGHGDGLLKGWVPWYTMHKLFNGLRDAWLYTGSVKAKDVLIKLADWAVETTKRLDHAQWQVMLSQEHGGMNEVLADVYSLTGNRKYLELAEKFHHDAVLTPLSERRDSLTGIHGNTQVPKLIGLARLYELTGDPKDRTAAEFFWDRVVDTRTYAIGGNTDYEHFPAPNELAAHLSPSTAETCNTYNMLKLTRHLFTWEPSVRYADYYERALYNHILAQQEPKRGMLQYYDSLKPGHFKTYSTPFDSFWCCVGTGLENHVKYGNSIYFHDAGSLMVNLFIPSVLKWREKGLTLRQETRFPEAETTRLLFTAEKPVRMTLKVRYPSWSRDASVSVNGEVQRMTAKPGSYITIARPWKTGDTVDVRLPMHLSTEAMPDDARKVAILYGPIVLAGQLGHDGLKPPIPYAADQGAYFGVPDPPVPVILHRDRPVTDWVKPVKGQALTFRTAGASPKDVTLRPFYSTWYDRYTVYWDTFTPAEWEERQAQYRAEQARQRALDARTVDAVRVGEQQPEVDHEMAGENTRSGPFQDRRWRDASDGGWFSYRLEVLPGALQDLVCTYWGGDAGGRTFDILVDGKVLATETLDRNDPGRFFDKTYSIPADFLAGKGAVTVRFQAKPGAMAGGVFNVRVVRREG